MAQPYDGEIAAVDRLVDHAFAPQPLIEAEFTHQVDRALLQHAGADAMLDVVAVVRLEHDALDPGHLQQARQREPGRSGADDADLGSQLPSSSSTR